MSSETGIPDWVRGAVRVDRPEINGWYKPEDGPLDGHLIWRGQLESLTTGDVYNAYAVRVAAGGKVLGVSERAGLRGLRSVRVGSRVFIRPTGEKVLESGRRMQQFEITAEQLEPLGEPVKGSAALQRGAGTARGSGSAGGAVDSDPDGSDKVPF